MNQCRVIVARLSIQHTKQESVILRRKTAGLHPQNRNPTAFRPPAPLRW